MNKEKLYKNKKIKEIKKVWTTYNVASGSPYAIHIQIGDGKTNQVFATRFFAIRRAKKIARILGVDPDLSFIPTIIR